MKCLQIGLFLIFFPACKKESNINKDPIYSKLIGKWVECGNKASTVEFRENGQIKIDRLLERSDFYVAHEVLYFNGNGINGTKWNQYGFIESKYSGSIRFGVGINENFDSIYSLYKTKINNSTTTNDYVYFTKE